MKRGHFPSLHMIHLGAMCRRWARSLVLVLLAALGTFSSMVLQNLVDRQSGGIQAVQQATEIRCTVTDVQGMNSERLEMSTEVVERLLTDPELSGYVKNVRARATAPLTRPSGYNLCRIMSLDSDSRLSNLNGAKIQLYEGWEETVFSTDALVCLVTPEVTVEERSGKKYVILQESFGAEAEAEVIGTVTGGPQGVIYAPYYTVLDPENKIGLRIESCSFDIRDNANMEESQRVIYQSFVEPSLNNLDKPNLYGVLIDDAIYQQNIRDYHANLATLELLLPVLVGVCCFIGFFVSYLTTKGRIKEYAVMRCLGMSRFTVFLLVFEELLLLTLLGGGLGFVGGTQLDGGLTMAAARVGGIVVGALLLGAIAAAIRVTSINAMKLMKVEG